MVVAVDNVDDEDEDEVEVEENEDETDDDDDADGKVDVGCCACVGEMMMGLGRVTGVYVLVRVPAADTVAL